MATQRRPPRTKSLPKEQLDAARKFALKYRDENYNGVTQRMAEGLGYSQSTLFNFFAERGGVGFYFLEKLSTVSGVPIDEILGKATTTRTIRLPGVKGSDDKFPNRAEAVGIAKRLGYSRAAIQLVSSMESLRDDLPVRHWLDLIRRRDEEQEILGDAPHGTALRTESD